MACRKGLLSEDQKCRNGSATAAAAPPVAANDALLFATMCIIGLPVVVHAKDGSVYSGVFHTASVDNDYAIVLKKARVIKKGNQESNIVNGSLIETLVVQSKDLVQVVAKGILVPSNGITGSIREDSIDGILGHCGWLDRGAKEIKANETKSQRKHQSQKRSLSRNENNVPCGTASSTTNLVGASSQEHNGSLGAAKFVKIEDSQNSSLLERQVGADGSHEAQSNGRNGPELDVARTDDAVSESNLKSSSCKSQLTTDVNILKERKTQQTAKTVSPGCSGFENRCHGTSEETKCTVISTPKLSGSTVSVPDIRKRSILTASSNSFLPLPLENSSFNKSAKESKLNPGAKTFFPSMPHHKSIAPPLEQSGGTVSYIPAAYTTGPIVNAQQEADPNPFARLSLTAKSVPYNNVDTRNGGSDVHYVQPNIGQVVNRTQPVRYAGQFHNVQTGTSYVHPNPQNVMFGRIGPLFCMHPFSYDAVQGPAGFSPATVRPLLTPHHVYLPKHQGNASAQALQLCMNPQLLQVDHNHL